MRAATGSAGIEDVELLQALQKICETKPVKFEAERFNRSTMCMWDSRERLESPPFGQILQDGPRA
jgi:hypothetical protein